MNITQKQPTLKLAIISCGLWLSAGCSAPITTVSTSESETSTMQTAAKERVATTQRVRAENAKELTEAVKQVGLRATVHIANLDDGSSGSGIAVGEKDGFVYVLTAEHVLGQSKKRHVVALVDGQPKAFERPEIVWREKNSDLALLRFASGGENVLALPIAARSGATMQFPFAAFNLGWTEEKAATAYQDKVLARKLMERPDGSSAFFWQIAGTSEEGRSGGGLINAEGKVIGICSGNQDGKARFTHLDEIYAAFKKDRSSLWLVEGLSP